MLLFQQYIDCITSIMDGHALLITKALKHPIPVWMETIEMPSVCLVNMKEYGIKH